MANEATAPTDLRKAFGDLVVEDAARAAVQAGERRAAIEQRRAAVAPLARWHVVHASGSDVRAKEWLTRSEIEFYYPQTREYRPAPKRRVTPSKRNALLPTMVPVLRPLFKGYFFVRFDLRHPLWRDAFDHGGIAGIIANPGGDVALPAPVAETDIVRLKRKEVDGAISIERLKELWVKEIPFKPGERVLIGEGSLIGEEAEVWSIPEDVDIDTPDDRVRIKLLVAILGRRTVVELPLTSILKA